MGDTSAAYVSAAGPIRFAEGSKVDTRNGAPSLARQAQRVSLAGAGARGANSNGLEVDLVRVAAGLLEQRQGVGLSALQERPGNVIPSLGSLSAGGLTLVRLEIAAVVALVAAVGISGEVWPEATEAVAVHPRLSFAESEQVDDDWFRS